MSITQIAVIAIILDVLTVLLILYTLGRKHRATMWWGVALLLIQLYIPVYALATQKTSIVHHQTKTYHIANDKQGRPLYTVEPNDKSDVIGVYDLTLRDGGKKSIQVDTVVYDQKHSAKVVHDVQTIEHAFLWHTVKSYTKETSVVMHTVPIIVDTKKDNTK